MTELRRIAFLCQHLRLQSLSPKSTAREGRLHHEMVATKLLMLPAPRRPGGEASLTTWPMPHFQFVGHQLTPNITRQGSDRSQMFSTDVQSKAVPLLHLFMLSDGVRCLFFFSLMGGLNTPGKAIVTISSILEHMK